MTSLYTGVAGMLAQQRALDVIANNIANINTIAYKAGRVSFEDTLANLLSGGASSGINPAQVGTGVSLGSIEVLMTQGDTRPTGRTLDLAVVGDGFFMVQDGTVTRYTRDGIAQLDSENRLTRTGDGFPLLGWQADPLSGSLNTGGIPTEMHIPLGERYARATSAVTLHGNLDPNQATAGQTQATFSVYDSLGSLHDITLNFTRTADGQWQWQAESPDAATGVPLGTGTITFNDNGQVTGSTGTISLSLASPNGAATPIAITLDVEGITQLEGDNSVELDTQDGLPPGTLHDYSIGENGVITGLFSNGATRPVGQLALAHFPNAAGLLRGGDNLWDQSVASGVAHVSAPDTNTSKVRSGFLEMSNVDLTNEFANLVVAQRGFQANARSITTSDEVMQEILQMKR